MKAVTAAEELNDGSLARFLLAPQHQSQIMLGRAPETSVLLHVTQHTNTQTHTHTHTQTQTHKYTHTHAHTHTQTCSSACPSAECSVDGPLPIAPQNANSPSCCLLAPSPLTASSRVLLLRRFFRSGRGVKKKNHDQQRTGRGMGDEKNTRKRRAEDVQGSHQSDSGGRGARRGRAAQGVCVCVCVLVSLSTVWLSRALSLFSLSLSLSLSRSRSLSLYRERERERERTHVFVNSMPHCMFNI